MIAAISNPFGTLQEKPGMQTPAKEPGENNFSFVLTKIQNGASRTAKENDKTEDTADSGGILAVSKDEQYPDTSEKAETNNLAIIVPMVLPVVSLPTAVLNHLDSVGTDTQNQGILSEYAAILTKGSNGNAVLSTGSENMTDTVNKTNETKEDGAKPEAAIVFEDKAGSQTQETCVAPKMAGQEPLPLGQRDTNKVGEEKGNIPAELHPIAQQAAEGLMGDDASQTGLQAKFLTSMLKAQISKAKSVGGKPQSELVKSKDQAAPFPITVDSSLPSNGGEASNLAKDQTTAGSHNQELMKESNSISGITQEHASCQKEETGCMQGKTFGLAVAKTDPLVVETQIAADKVQGIDDGEAFSQISNQIVDSLQEKNSTSFKMKLQPEGLGEISVTLTCKDDKVTLAILTDNPSTQKLLEAQAGDLKAALLAKNYEVIGLEVRARSESTIVGGTPFTFEGNDLSFGQNNGSAFREHDMGGSWDGENQEQAFYQVTDDLLSSAEDKRYGNWQGFYAGRLNFWA